VEEHVLVCPGFDESETLVRQPFDSAFCHTITFLKNSLAASPDIIWPGRSTA
jgi:hypothetical protein